MDLLKAFISSVIPGMIAEREAARQGVDDTGLAQAWLFERDSASTKPLEDSYLDSLRESDVLVVIVGDTITPPVLKEYELARNLQIPILIFVRCVQTRPETVCGFLKSADLKYAEFDSPPQLRIQVRDAIRKHVLEIVKSGGSRTHGLGLIREKLGQMMKESNAVQIRPIVPSTCEDNIFHIRKVERDFLLAQKLSNQQSIAIPLGKVLDVYATGERAPFVVEINGRLQWIDPEERWKFLPEPPSAGDPFGLVKEVYMQQPRITRLVDELRARDHQLSWKWEHEAKAELGNSCAVIYNRDGRYLRQPGRPYNQVLVRSIKQ